MKPYAENRRARHEYECLKAFEGGLMLTGAETKSIRNGGARLAGSYLRVRGGELWLIGSQIARYAKTRDENYDPERLRKILVHKAEMLFLAQKTQEKGLTLVPFSVYPVRRRLKLSFGLCRGKSLHDKREKLKARDLLRTIRREGE